MSDLKSEDQLGVPCDEPVGKLQKAVGGDDHVGQYSDQRNTDAECEKLLKNTKKQVKQMMEEAVTKKFIHQESNSIMSLCVAVDACLTHGLRRRALGLFKTNSSTALVQKMAKSCKSAQEVLEIVNNEETKISHELQQNKTNRQEQHSHEQLNKSVSSLKSPLKQVSCNSVVHKRNMWIKYALIDKKLVSIVEHLSENSSKYYEPDALMANYLCAQILSSLLVGPSALEFSRSNISDSYQFDDPTADELIRRHKLANPIACLCNKQNQPPQYQASRLVTDLESSKQSRVNTSTNGSMSALDHEKSSIQENTFTSLINEPESGEITSLRPVNSCKHSSGRKENRRRPLSLKTNLKTGILVTDCHHYSCQEISEHQQTKGYLFLCSPQTDAPHTSNQPVVSSTGSSHSSSARTTQDWPLWSPRMLHETLHQNSRSSLLYAKNNVLLEAQPDQAMPGYLSLHQTSSDLILKWIPNQMINGSTRCDLGRCVDGDSHENSLTSIESASVNNCQQVPVESSYLDLVVSLSVSRIVLLHCQFDKYRAPNKADLDDTQVNSSDNKEDDQNNQVENHDSTKVAPRAPDTEETLILVEMDGVQRAPFKFPKGGLRLFLSCLESGLKPNKYLDPAINFDDCWPESPSEQATRPQSPIFNATAMDSPSAVSDSHSGTSKLDILLRRLPSLKRRIKLSEVDTNCSNNSRTGSPEAIHAANRPSHVPTNNYVYRIVSVQQDWVLLTPPHSAMSVASSSSGSFGGSNNKQVTGPQKFRWTLARLAKLSSRYTNSGSTTSSSCGPGGQNSSSTLANGSLNSSLLEGTSIGDPNDSTLSCQTISGSEDGKIKDNSKDLARIEAKLEDLKKSTSDDIIALRTQSIQALCESMRRQIIARAFYGWLAHCRRDKIIRTHLVKLIHQSEKCSLVDLDQDFARHESLKQGLTRVRWEQLIGRSGHMAESELSREINLLVYYGGVENDQLRKEVWPYLLGYYKFKDTKERRRDKDRLAREAYENCSRNWIEVEQLVKRIDNKVLAANMARASRDSKTEVYDNEVKSSTAESDSEQKSLTNESQELDSFDEQTDNQDVDEKQLESRTDSNDAENQNDSTVSKQEIRGQRMRKVKMMAKKRRRRVARLESTGSVGSDASITDKFGNNIHRIDKDVQRCDRNFWYFKEVKNLDKLRNIMCSYVWEHLDVGYVQGMCDLAAPFLVIFDDELLAYSCFSRLMRRMVANFPYGNAMDQHFESLKFLMQVLDPKLFEVLQSNGDYTHFYFCYRWLLLDFKRELAYEDVYQVWETIWSARRVATDNFVVFMALAMVRYYRDIIIENNMDFTDTIKFFNEMAERHDAKRIVALARDCVVELQNLIRA